MRLLTLAFPVVLAVSAISVSHSAQCSNEQAKASSTEDPAFAKACPSLAANISNDLYEPLSEGNALTAENLKAIESCKDSACVQYLSALPSQLPECETGPMNPRSVFQILAQLCTSFGSGNSSVASSNEIVKDIAKNITQWSQFGGLGPQLNVSGADSVTTSPPTTVPPPTATPKSHATLVAVASVSTLASAAAAAVFLP